MRQYKYLTGIVNKLQTKQRLDQIAAEIFSNYSRSIIKSWILNGWVKVNGQIILVPKKKMCGGEYIEIAAVIKERSHWKARNIKLNIMYEDKDILVINKPRSLVVHYGAGDTEYNLLSALIYYFPPIKTVPRAGIIHRLDKDTTGLMVVAKTLHAQIKLVEMLRTHKITREYEAIAIGAMITGGIIDQPIARHPTKRTHMTVGLGGKPAITHYRIIERFHSYTHLRLRLETGRTHQIRVHMAHINHPLLGDPLYSGRLQIPKNASDALIKVIKCFDRQALHATMLQFYHPVTSIKMQFLAPLPRDMTELLSVLKKDIKAFK